MAGKAISPPDMQNRGANEQSLARVGEDKRAGSQSRAKSLERSSNDGIRDAMQIFRKPVRVVDAATALHLRAAVRPVHGSRTSGGRYHGSADAGGAG